METGKDLGTTICSITVCVQEREIGLLIWNIWEFTIGTIMFVPILVPKVMVTCSGR